MNKYYLIYLVFYFLPLYSLCQTNQAHCISYGELSNDDITIIKRNSFDDTLNLPIPRLDSPMYHPYSEPLQKLYQHKQKNLYDFLKTIVVLVDGIDKICIRDSSISLYLLQNDSINYFIDAGYFNYSWQYYFFHDIYYSFFSYPSINKVSVYVNNESYTILPQTGNFDEIYVEKNFLLRRYYILGLDYSKIQINDIDYKCYYNNDGKVIVKNDCLIKFVLKLSE